MKKSFFSKLFSSGTSLWLLASLLIVTATILVLFGVILFAGVYGFISQNDLAMIIPKTTTRPILFFLAGITLAAAVVLLFKIEKKLQIKKDKESEEKWKKKFEGRINE